MTTRLRSSAATVAVADGTDPDRARNVCEGVSAMADTLVEQAQIVFAASAESAIGVLAQWTMAVVLRLAPVEGEQMLRAMLRFAVDAQRNPGGSERLRDSSIRTQTAWQQAARANQAALEAGKVH